MFAAVNSCSVEVWIMLPEPAGHGVLSLGGPVQGVQLLHLLPRQLEVPDVQVGLLARRVDALWHEGAVMLQTPPSMQTK